MKHDLPIENVKKAIAEAYLAKNSWRKIGVQFGISPAMAYRIANEPGYEPKGAKIRCKLGLPALIPTPVCLYCGEVHTKKSCPYKRKYSKLDQVPTRTLAQWFIHRTEV